MSLKLMSITFFLIFSFSLQGELIKGFMTHHLHLEIRWEELRKNGFKFGLIRFGAYYLDKIIYCCFWSSNYNNAKRLGFDFGIMFSNYVFGEAEEKMQALTLLRYIKNYKFEYPVFLSVDEDLKKYGKTLVSASVRTFCDTLIQNRYLCGFYADADFIEEYFEDDLKTNYPILLKFNKNGNQSRYKGKFDIRETSPETNLNGIDYEFSYSISEVDFPTYIKENHYNGY